MPHRGTGTLRAMLEWLGITPDEQREKFNLIGADEKRRRNTESRRQKRRAAGARPRAETYRQRRTTARDLRDRPQLPTAAGRGEELKRLRKERGCWPSASPRCAAWASAASRLRTAGRSTTPLG